jgi:hypothetical protein
MAKRLGLFDVLKVSESQKHVNKEIYFLVLILNESRLFRKSLDSTEICPCPYKTIKHIRICPNKLQRSWIHFTCISEQQRHLGTGVGPDSRGGIRSARRWFGNGGDGIPCG